MKLITPNKYDLALKEIPKGLDDKVLKAIKKIQESEKDHYFCLGIKARPSKDQMSTVYDATPQFANKKAWDKMQKQIAKGRFKGEFGGKFTKVVILHDPTYTPPKKKEEPSKEEKKEA